MSNDAAFLGPYLRGLNVPDELVGAVADAVLLLSDRRSNQLLSEIRQADKKVAEAQALHAAAEGRHAAAEGRYAAAEGRWAEATLQMSDLRLEALEFSIAAKERFFELAELKHGISIREELKRIQDTAIIGLLAQQEGVKGAGRPSQKVKWQFIFEEALTSKKRAAVAFRRSCKECGFALNASKLADEMVRITVNHDKNFHRKIKQDELRRFGGIPLIESKLLPVEDCRVVKMVFDYQKIPASILAYEEAAPKLDTLEQQSRKNR